MKTRPVHSRAVTRALFSTAAALVGTSLGIATAAAAEILPCDGIAHDLSDGRQLGKHALDPVFPRGVRGKRTVVTTDVRGEVFATSGAGWLWADAWGDVDLEAGGALTACIDAAKQRVTFTWEGVAQKGGDAGLGNTFQMVLRPSDACEAGAELEVRIADLGWPILLEAASPDGFAPFGFHADHGASSNAGEPGVYRFDSCPAERPEETIAEGLSFIAGDHEGGERVHTLQVAAASEATPSAARVDEDITFTPGSARSAHTRSAEADDAPLTDADHEDEDEDEDEESGDQSHDAGAGCSAAGGSTSVAEGLIVLLGLAAAGARRGRRVTSRNG